MDDTKDIALAIGITIAIIVAFFAISAMIAVIVPLAIFAGLSFIVFLVLSDNRDKGD